LISTNWPLQATSLSACARNSRRNYATPMVSTPSSNCATQLKASRHRYPSSKNCRTHRSKLAIGSASWKKLVKTLVRLTSRQSLCRRCSSLNSTTSKTKSMKSSMKLRKKLTMRNKWIKSNNNGMWLTSISLLIRKVTISEDGQLSHQKKFVRFLKIISWSCNQFLPLSITNQLGPKLHNGNKTWTQSQTHWTLDDCPT